MTGDVQILTEHADNDGYWVGVKKSPYNDDEWLLNLMFQDAEQWCYAHGVTNNHFRLTTAQILGMPPVAKLVDALDQLVRFCEMMELPDDLQTIAKARAALDIEKGNP